MQKIPIYYNLGLFKIWAKIEEILLLQNEGKILFDEKVKQFFPPKFFEEPMNL